jgi:PH (Pleckstrin Homology) domain-containing protein
MSPLSIIAIVILVPLLTSWVTRETRRTPSPRPDGSITLTFGNRYLGMGLLTLLGGPAMCLWAAIRFGFTNRGDPFVFGSILAAFLLGGAWMCINVLRTRVVVSQDGISSVSAFRASRTMTWSQIERVSYNGLMSWVVLWAHGRQPIRISRFMVGFHELVDAIRDHVPPTARSRVLDIFATARKDAA